MFKRLYLLIFMFISSGLTLSAQTGTWSGKLDIQGAKLSLVFHLEEEKPTMDSPDQGAEGIEIQVKRTSPSMIEIRVPSLGASFEGIWMGKKIIGTFKQMTVSLPLTLTPGEDRPLRPQTPKEPFPYSTEEVSFSNGDIVLNGTIVLPEGYSRKTPALVMVTGSGIQNRDEEIFDHKPFAVIADALARIGIVTLRYDDRGYGDPSANAITWTTDDFKEDASAAIKFMRERFDKVGVIGHSEGGTIAMMLAAENRTDFIISLAGMAVSGSETLLYQNRLALLEAEVPENAVETYCKLLKESFDAAVNDLPMPDIDVYALPDGLRHNLYAVQGQIRMPYMKHFLSLDTRPLLGKIRCPVLAMNGTKDQQVECLANLDALSIGLSAAATARIKSVEQANHLLQNCRKGSVAEYREIEETISPKVLEMITGWISEYIISEDIK